MTPRGPNDLRRSVPDDLHTRAPVVEHYVPAWLRTQRRQERIAALSKWHVEHRTPTGLALIAERERA